MKTRGMTLEQRAEWVANATRPALQVGGVRWKLIYDRALEALQDTHDGNRATI